MILKVEEILRLSDYLKYLPNKWGVFNSGLIYDNGWLLSARNFISSKNNKYYGRKAPDLSKHCPVFIRFDDDFGFLSADKAILSDDRNLEDTRLFRWRGELFMCGSQGVKPNIDIFLAKVVENSVIFLPFNHDFSLRQKNWVPLSLHNLYFEMSPSGPRRIVKYNHDQIEIIHQEGGGVNLRGNCSVDIGDFFLSFYHYHIKRDYYHVAALVDKKPPFNIKKLSYPWKFSVLPRKIQFLTGCVLRDKDLIFSYGVQDADNIVAKCSVNYFLSLVFSNSQN